MQEVQKLSNPKWTECQSDVLILPMMQFILLQTLVSETNEFITAPGLGWIILSVLLLVTCWQWRYIFQLFSIITMKSSSQKINMLHNYDYIGIIYSTVLIYVQGKGIRHIFKRLVQLIPSMLHYFSKVISFSNILSFTADLEPFHFKKKKKKKKNHH
jgi:hypothetical protein